MGEQEGATNEQIQSLPQFKFRRRGSPPSSSRPLTASAALSAITEALGVATTSSSTTTNASSSSGLNSSAAKGSSCDDGNSSGDTGGSSGKGTASAGAEGRDEVRVTIDEPAGGVMTQVGGSSQPPREREVADDDALLPVVMHSCPPFLSSQNRRICLGAHGDAVLVLLRPITLPLMFSSSSPFSSSHPSHLPILSSSQECCICLGPYEDAVLLRELPCSHHFQLRLR
ncbi:unnamed protein product [Closterium sp. NIES-65]|nr:unnamed protein product [Closterium sp. NIES-65]